MQVNVAGFRRNIKNLAHNYSDAQIKVREATSNDPWGPSATIMAEIADLTYNVVAFSEIMQMIWKRLNDHGKNWRHVYKALILLEYLIKTGTEKVAQQCKENIFAIQTLKEFQYYEEGKDQGLHVREKAKQLVSLLKDDERLKNERTKALKAKERFAQHASGFGSDGSIDGPTSSSVRGESEMSPTWLPPPSGNTASRTASEIEYVRPQTVGEEELQLQLAMAMSREEAEQEEAKRRSDDVRLQLALSQSEQDFKKSTTEPPKQPPQSHLMDLLDINMGNTSLSSPPPTSDPWGMSGPNRSQRIDDPWSRTSSPPVDPWQPTIGISRQIGGGGVGGASNVEGWLSRTQSPSVASGSSTEGWLQNNGTQPVQTVNPVLNGNINNNNNNNNNNNSDPWLTKDAPAIIDPFIVNITPSDPWQTKPNAPPAPPTHSDPWAPFLTQTSPTMVTSPSSDLEEFDVITNRTKTTNGNNLLNNNYSLNNNNNNNNNLSLLDEMDPLSMKKPVTKTPQSFLGENSSLVNLDNLIKPSVPNNVGQQPAYNPFGEMQQPQRNNLFQQQTHPHPSINQLKQTPFPVTLNQDPWAPVTTNNTNPNNNNNNNINNNTIAPWMMKPEATTTSSSSNPFLS